LLENLKRIGKGGVAFLITLFVLRKWRRLAEARHSLIAQRAVTSDPIPDIFPQFIRNEQGLWLYTRAWEVPSPRAVIFISHGYGEHCGRYDHVALLFNQAGYSVYAVDHQGHGMSDGDRAFIPCFQDIVKDFLYFVNDRLARGPVLPIGDSKFTELPRFLVGHSMGALVAIHTAQLAASLFTGGVILSGAPLQRDPVTAPDWLLSIVKILSRFLPKIQLTGLDSSFLSREVQVVKRYQLDPLVYLGRWQALSAFQVFQAMQEAIDFAPKVSWPFLILHGKSDKICLVQGAEMFLRVAQSADKTIKLYDGAYHEIFQETSRREVWNDMLNWIQERVSRSNR